MVSVTDKPFYILTLDGGGSKGIFTLGVLEEVEKMIGTPLHKKFNLIFGTSVGAIIGAKIGLGARISEIEKLYFKTIPNVMKKRLPHSRSKALQRAVQNAFQNQKFDAFQTNVGIVATNYELRKPMIFKNSAAMAHGRQTSFVPGFGCTIAEAIVASCAAVPFFRPRSVETSNQNSPILIDGGYVANNPTLFAIADALGPLGISKDRIRVLSVGVGSYRERPSFTQWALEKILPVETVFTANTNTLEIIRTLLFKDISVVRVDGAYPDKQYQTSLVESDVDLLKKLKGLGREAFASSEEQLRDLLT